MNIKSASTLAAKRDVLCAPVEVAEEAVAVGCSHSEFDSWCDSCLLQYDQAESARWAAEEAQKARWDAQDHQRRMEQEARRSAAKRPDPGFRQDAPGGSSGPVLRPGGDAITWVFVIGVAVIVGISAVMAVIASIAAAIAQLVKVAVVVGLIAAVGMFVLKKYRESSGA